MQSKGILERGTESAIGAPEPRRRRLPWRVVPAFFQRVRGTPDKTRQTLATAHPFVGSTEVSKGRRRGSTTGEGEVTSNFVELNLRLDERGCRVPLDETTYPEL